MTMPEEYLGKVIELCEANRGEQKGLDFFHSTQVILVYDLPAAQLVDDFFGKLKGATYVPSSVLVHYSMLMNLAERVMPRSTTKIPDGVKASLSSCRCSLTSTLSMQSREWSTSHKLTGWGGSG